MNLTLGRIQPSNQGQQRYVRLAQTVLTALAGKGLTFVVGFISVPLTVGYLGAERYGVWVTISSLLVWLTIADLGLGSSLTNAVAKAYGKDEPELARRYVATTFWLLVLIALALGGLAALLWYWVDWVALFNVRSSQAQAETPLAVAVAIVLFLLNFPFSIVAKIYGAYQEGATANYWAAGGSVASLLAIIVVTQTQGGLVWLVLAFSGATLLVNVLSALWLFGWQKPWLRPTLGAVERRYVSKLAGIGGMFFVVQVAALLNFQTDNVIIARLLGAEQVTPYSVTWRLFAYTTLVQTLVFPALWPAYAEAVARGDGPWIKRTLRLNMLFSVGITAVLLLPLLLYGTTIINWWAGSSAVPPQPLLYWMGAWSLLFALMQPSACLLNGCGRVRWQALYALVTAVANIGLSIILVTHWGVTGAIAATVLTYSLCTVVPQLFETRYALTLVSGR